MSTVTISFGANFEVEVPLLIAGAGAAGLCAALAAKEAGVEALVIERDAVPAGSTALSAGLIPAAATRLQRTKGIIDSPQLFAADIQRKAKGEADAAVVDAVAHGSGLLVEWLMDRYGLPSFAHVTVDGHAHRPDPRCVVARSILAAPRTRSIRRRSHNPHAGSPPYAASGTTRLRPSRLAR